MIRISILFVFLLSACSILFVSCSKSKNENVSPIGNASDRQLMLTNIADNIILPGYVNFKIKLDSMTKKSDAFRSAPNLTTLAAFRQAWKEAYIEWQKVEIFDVGPAMDYSMRSFFNIYPAKTADINANIASGTATLETFASYTAQGFPALDYLINGLATTDEDILAYYTTSSDADKRLAYVLKITNQMNGKLTFVQNEWASGYRNIFVTKTSMDIYASTSLLVNGMVMDYERYIRSGKFGIPSGAMLNGVANSAYTEAYYSKDLSLILAKTAHQAYIDFFNGKSVLTGTEGPSLKTYLNSLEAKDSKTGTSLTEIINAQFIAVNDKLNLLGPNLKTEVETNNDAMKAVYTEMQKVVRMLKVDMTSAMSVTITYTDNDGD